MSTEAVETQLQDIFRDVIGVPDFVLTREMVTGAHPYWNSIANVEILIRSEERWGFEFNMAEIDRIRSFGDLADAIAAKIG